MNNVLKISDFGLSRFTNEVAELVSRVGTLPYMSPQVLDHDQNYSYKCDIWSFGVVCYEFATGSFPWKKISSNSADFLLHIAKVCEEGIEFPENIKIDEQFKNLVLGCLVYTE